MKLKFGGLHAQDSNAFWTLGDAGNAEPEAFPLLNILCPECGTQNDIEGHTVTITAKGVITVEGVIACYKCDWVGKITKGEFT